MKILHRSILRELVLAFFISLASLNFILMTEKLLRLSRILSSVGASVFDMARLILYVQPPLLLLTVPMAFLLATLVVYGKLNMDNELIIMRMSGMPFSGTVVPVVVLGIACFFLSLFVSFYAGPKSATAVREETADIVKRRTPVAIEEGTFSTVFRDVVIFVKEKPTEHTVRNLFLYDSRNKAEPRVLIAREGTVQVHDGFTISLLLRDGSLNTVRGGRSTDVFFDRYHMSLKLEPGHGTRKNSEMTLTELLQEARKAGKCTPAALCLELYRRFSLPVMSLILIFLGPPLAVRAGRTGTLGGLTVGLIVFTAYYMVLIYGENLARAGSVPSVVGGWGATVIVVIAALLLFRRESLR